MSQYVINEEDLSKFINKVYEEGAFGYIDLKESVCEKMLSDFLFLQHKFTSQVSQNVCYESNVANLSETPANDSVCIHISTIGGNYYEITDSHPSGNDIPVFVCGPHLSPINHFVTETGENSVERIGSHSFNSQPEHFESTVSEDAQTKIRVVNYNFNGNESERL